MHLMQPCLHQHFLRTLQRLADAHDIADVLPLTDTSTASQALDAAHVLINGYCYWLTLKTLPRSRIQRMPCGCSRAADTPAAAVHIAAAKQSHICKRSCSCSRSSVPVKLLFMTDLEAAAQRTGPGRCARRSRRACCGRPLHVAEQFAHTRAPPAARIP